MNIKEDVDQQGDALSGKNTTHRVTMPEEEFKEFSKKMGEIARQQALDRKKKESSHGG